MHHIFMYVKKRAVNDMILRLLVELLMVISTNSCVYYHFKGNSNEFALWFKDYIIYVNKKWLHSLYVIIKVRF